MSRDILSEYGPDHRATTHSSGSSGITTDGGKPYCKPENYSPPKGPIHQGGEGPGLRGGTNIGHDQKAAVTDESGGAPGNHGSNHGNKGSQGSY